MELTEALPGMLMMTDEAEHELTLRLNESDERIRPSSPMKSYSSSRPNSSNTKLHYSQGHGRSD